MSKYINKPVNFKKKEPDDMKLHNELKKLPHGDFSRITKQMWEERLRKEGDSENRTRDRERN